MTKIRFVLLLFFVIFFRDSDGIERILDNIPVLLTEYNEDILCLGIRMPIVWKSKQYWESLIHISRQNALIKLANIITGSNVKKDIKLILQPKWMRMKHFWYLYVALIHHKSIFIETFHLEYNSLTNSIIVPYNFTAPTGNQNRSSSIMIYIQRYRQLTSLYINANWETEFDLNYNGFIDDPWDGLTIIFNEKVYDRIKEQKFMRNTQKWKLSPKYKLIIGGITCTLPDYPCNFGFVSYVETEFIIRLTYVPQQKKMIYIDLHDIIFGDEMGMKHFSIQAITFDDSNLYNIILPNQKHEFINTISLPGNTLLHKYDKSMNMNIYNINVHDFAESFTRLTLNPSILDFNKLLDEDTIASEFLFHITCIKGISTELDLTLQNFYDINAHGTLIIFNFDLITKIKTKGFTCTLKGREARLSSLFNNFECRKDNYYILLKIVSDPETLINVPAPKSNFIFFTKCFHCENERTATPNLVIKLYLQDYSCVFI